MIKIPGIELNESFFWCRYQVSLWEVRISNENWIVKVLGGKVKNRNKYLCYIITCEKHYVLTVKIRKI
jgi:hypothetical protein